MKADHDGVIRQEWRPQPTHPPAVSARAGPEIVTSEPLAPATKPFIVSSDIRVEEWIDRLEALVDDEIEAGEELSDVEIIAEAVGLLQNATDRALADVVDKLRVETGALRRSLDSVTASLSATRRKQVEERAAMRARITDLEGKLAEQQRTYAVEAERWLSELRTLAAEQAEQRAVADLRHSRTGRSHSAKVQMRLLRRELEQEAKAS
jgi:hypothetical protein